MLIKFRKFVYQSASKKFYSLLWLYNYVKTQYFYSFFLKKLGEKSVVCKPLFWTSEKVTIGNNCYIWPDSRIQALDQYKGQSFDSHIIFEDNVSMQERCHIAASDELIIGRNTTIASNVMIQDVDHDYEQLDVNILDQRLISKKILIGENCFIGTGAKVLAGTVLGKQCIVGANSVVRGIFPDYCVIVGMPGKIVKVYNHELKIWERFNNNE